MQVFCFCSRHCFHAFFGPLSVLLLISEGQCGVLLFNYCLFSSFLFRRWGEGWLIFTFSMWSATWEWESSLKGRLVVLHKPILVTKRELKDCLCRLLVFYFILLLKCMNMNWLSWVKCCLGCCGSKSYRGVPRTGGGTSMSGLVFCFISINDFFLCKICKSLTRIFPI